MSDAQDLVIVESPSKAKAIQKYLGDAFVVLASRGHVRDLVENKLGVDVQNGFRGEYIVLPDKEKLISYLAAQSRKARALWLATDPDREGEAIAWHLSELLARRGQTVHRVTFNEITPEAVREAFKHPRPIDHKLVEAQHARRVLDRLVGYLVSPLTAESLNRRGLSAGRVQTPALGLIVDRERQIQTFVPKEYWVVDVTLSKKSGERFKARLLKANDKPIALSNQAHAEYAVRLLKASEFRVADVHTRQQAEPPPPPFTTSTLQQESSRWYGFSPEKTMHLAQTLYEGVEIAGEVVGLITYMRTDSVDVSHQAQSQARDWIAKHLGEAYLPARPPVYRTRSKHAQEAHEAIRPTDIFRTPKMLKGVLSEDLYKLYELIWRRFVASQMTPARFEVITVWVEATNSIRPDLVLRLKAQGKRMLWDGYRRIYISKDKHEHAPEPRPESESQEEQEDEEEKGWLPPLSRGESLVLVDVKPTQRFTRPPSRYTEAELVKALERLGIGRPSTYAQIVSVLKTRGYCSLEDGHLRPTLLGEAVIDFLRLRFETLFAPSFTADMELSLDKIASGELSSVAFLSDFYKTLSGLLSSAASAEVSEDIRAKAQAASVPAVQKEKRKTRARAKRC